MRFIEKLATRADSVGKPTRQSVVEGDLIAPPPSIGKKMWMFCENGQNQVVNGITRGNALLNIYLVRPENLVNSCTTEKGITDH
jgi:hypothetical protein